MNVAAVIPARFGSTRFRGKPLAMICGKTMIQRVYEAARACSFIDRVVVATDSDDIVHAVAAFGGEAYMTSSQHVTGTDRVAETARDIDARIVINIQGDEPLLTPAAIEQAAGPLLSDASIPMGTLKTRILDQADCENANIVKVVTDVNDFALYFSRLPVPCIHNRHSEMPIFKHVGLYVYQKEFLIEFTRLPRSPLERAENLEQLRALENGYSIKVVETDYNPVSVDVPGDIARVEKLLR